MKVIKIEYFNDKETDEESTFELFDSVERAFDFTKMLGITIKEISVVEANKDNLYYEKDGGLNYEDNSELFDRELIDLEELSK